MQPVAIVVKKNMRKNACEIFADGVLADSKAYGTGITGNIQRYFYTEILFTA
jgi:hypothetical protein